MHRQAAGVMMLQYLESQHFHGLFFSTPLSLADLTISTNM
jgi:hypothetical protein